MRKASSIVLVLIIIASFASSLPVLGWDTVTPQEKLLGLGYWILLLEDGKEYNSIFNQDRIAAIHASQEPLAKLIESLGGKVIYKHWIINAISFKALAEVAYKLSSIGYTVIPSQLYEPQALSFKA